MTSDTPDGIACAPGDEFVVHLETGDWVAYEFEVAEPDTAAAVPLWVPSQPRNLDRSAQRHARRDHGRHPARQWREGGSVETLGPIDTGHDILRISGGARKPLVSFSPIS